MKVIHDRKVRKIDCSQRTKAGVGPRGDLKEKAASRQTGKGGESSGSLTALKGGECEHNLPINTLKISDLEDGGNGLLRKSKEVYTGSRRHTHCTAEFSCDKANSKWQSRQNLGQMNWEKVREASVGLVKL